MRFKGMSGNSIDLKNNVGKVVTLRGEITGIMWQHYVGSYAGYPFTNYVDLENHPG